MTNDTKRQFLIQIVNNFSEIFNTGPLEKVVELFSEDGTYVGFDGKSHQGKQAIHKAFEPFFRGDYGRVHFYPSNMMVDETNSSITVCWLCKHEMNQLQRVPFFSRLKRFLYKSIYGLEFGWEGLDIFHFSGGLVKSKQTYVRARIPIGLRKPILSNYELKATPNPESDT